MIIEKIPVKNTEQVLKFIFEFSLDYEPEIGKLQILGHILYLDDEKKIKDTLKAWKKNKEIDQNLMQQILNAALYRCSIRALSLSQEVNLPPHIAIPTLQPMSKNQKNYIG